MKLTALDFIEADDPVQAALDAARPGDRVYVPGLNGTRVNYPPNYYKDMFVAPVGGWKVKKSIEVYGDGPGHPGSHDGTTFSPGGDSDDVIVVEPANGPVEYAYLRAFKIKQRIDHLVPDGSSGVRTSVDNGLIGALRIERVSVLNLGEAAFFLDDSSPGETSIERVVLLDCHAVLVRGIGFHVRSVRLGVFAGDGASSCFEGGWRLERSAGLLLLSTADFKDTIEPSEPTPTGPHMVVG